MSHSKKQTELFIEKVQLLLKYLEHCEDEHAKVWLLSSQPSTFIHSTLDFEIGAGISIIDPFDGRHPWLLNKNFRNHKGTYWVKTYPSVLLDSQILTLLRKYFDKNSKIKSQDERCIHQLLKFFMAKNCDISPLFYLIESLAKNEDLNEIDKQKYVIRAMETILEVHLMDEKIFLNEERVTPNQERLELYKQKYNLSANSIKDIAPFWYQKNFAEIDDSNFIQTIKSIVNYTYAALLKMILIHKASGRGTLKKLQEFLSFLESEDFNMVLMREGVIAAYYFSNNLPDKFIQVQSDMDFAKVRKKMLGTAWDFLLLRMPENLLLYGTEQDTTLCYLCSADKAVRKLGRLFTIELISNQNQITTQLSFKYDKISRDLGKEVANKLCTQLQEQHQRRQKSLILNGVSPVPKENIDDLISDLENQVKVLCK
jgi:hypothetical protein